MAVTLISREMAGDHSLMHYRVGGEKKGVRRYQYKNGSYTPEGYKHYKEMYGWGKKKEASEKKPSLVERVKEHIEEQHEKNTPETRKEVRETDKEVEKKVAEGIEKATKNLSEKAEKREAEDVTLKETLKSVRSMSDDELNKQLDRLRREKQFSDLVSERDAREKGPLRTMANKLLRDAAEELGKKSLSAAIDALVGKIKNKAEGKGFKLADYQDVDLFSLSSDKISAINDAFQKAAQISQNRWKILHPGDNNQGQNQNQNSGNKNNNNSNSNNDNNNSGGGKLSKSDKNQVRSLAKSGKSVEDLAKQFGVSESYIRTLISA